jgi:hypothetical protein
MSTAAIDDVIAALQSKGTPGRDWADRQVLVTDSDVEKWCGQLGLSRSTLYDALALRLALRFHSNTLDFDFCDQVLNEIHGITTRRNEERPKLFWNVFLAFDAGEFYPAGSRSIDPVEAFTRPQIAKILQMHASRR